MQEKITETAKEWYPATSSIPQSLSHRAGFVEGGQWATKFLVEKACEWLENTLYIHTEIENDRDFNEICRTDWVTSDYDSVEDFINSFRKAMEKE